LIATAAGIVGPDLYQHFFGPLTKTTETTLRPNLAERLIPSLHVARRDKGECESSLADLGNPDAHRCFGAAEIEDPCFSFSGRRLVCLSSPWSKSVILFTATKIDPARSTPPTRKPPWALELANGKKCVFATGATTVSAGLRANYGCSDEDWVYGVPDRTRDLWYVQFGGARSTKLVRVGVKTAWK
jgi:hypothetical protein